MRAIVRQVIPTYIKRLGWEGEENVPTNQPVLFCVTHSNSFLDALILAAYLRQPLYPLTRGDAFRNPRLRPILENFKLLPIFRQSEGEADAEVKNEATFKYCQALFRKNQHVLIFPEGICKYQKEVLPLKKGAANIAKRAWEEGLPLQVIPVGVDYDTFNLWGKKCDIVIGKPIFATEFDIKSGDFTNQFNEKVFASMQAVFPTPYRFEGEKLHWGIVGQAMYYVGSVLNLPFNIFTKWLVNRLTKGTVFYDSAVVGFLSFLLPFYYLILILLVTYLL